MLRHAALALLIASPLALGCSASADGGGGDTDASVPSDSPPSDSATPTDGATPSDGSTGYTEALCNDTASLADLSAAYVDSPAGIRAAAHGIVERRYPMGVAFIEAQSDAQLGTWFRQHATFAQILGSVDVAVHEGGHIWDLTMISSTWPYRVRDDLVIRPRRLTNFNRSEILTLHVDAATDSYDEVYLTGQSGAQGFNTLLDEYVQYAHSLAVKYCTRDSLGAGTRTSARDGILTMMYYVELYLKKARTDHPTDYAAIIGDPEHVRLIRTVWQRAEFWLNVTASIPSLGLRDTTIRTWTYAPENLMEIERLPQ